MEAGIHCRDSIIVVLDYQSYMDDSGLMVSTFNSRRNGQGLLFNYFNGSNEGIIGGEAEIGAFMVKCGERLLEGRGM